LRWEARVAMEVKPIGPDDIPNQKLRDLPDAVIGAWNRVIARKYTGTPITIRQSEIIEEILSALNDGREQVLTTEDDVFKFGYLDVEELYRAAGWSVEYDKPAYNESYEPTFEFSRRE
jgi:hypothetical protein